jgi:hypothetical protein
MNKIGFELDKTWIGCQKFWCLRVGVGRSNEDQCQLEHMNFDWHSRVFEERSGQVLVELCFDQSCLIAPGGCETIIVCMCCTRQYRTKLLS